MLVHKPGKLMGKSDALSHHPDHPKGEDNNSDVIFLNRALFQSCTTKSLMLTGEESILLEHIWGCTDLDKSVSRILQDLQTNSLCADEWSVKDGLVLHCGQIYIPRDPQICHDIVQAH